MSACLLLAAGLSVIFIYLLMGFLFESFTLPLSIILTIPLAGLGVWWTHFGFGYNIDFLGGVGLVLLIGVVVNNGIVLVDYVNRLRNSGMDRTEALLTGGQATIPADHDDRAHDHLRDDPGDPFRVELHRPELHQLRPDPHRRAHHGNPLDPVGGAGLLHPLRRSRIDRWGVARRQRSVPAGGAARPLLSRVPRQGAPPASIATHDRCGVLQGICYRIYIWAGPFAHWPNHQSGRAGG